MAPTSVKAPLLWNQRLPMPVDNLSMPISGPITGAKCTTASSARDDAKPHRTPPARMISGALFLYGKWPPRASGGGYSKLPDAALPALRHRGSGEAW